MSWDKLPDPVSAEVRRFRGSHAPSRDKSETVTSPSLVTPDSSVLRNAPRHDDEYPAGVPKPIADAFEKFSLQVADAGRKRYSARGILERIRWHTTIEMRGEFKLNNNVQGDLSRWFLAKHPELGDFFETRKRNPLDEVKD